MFCQLRQRVHGFRDPARGPNGEHAYQNSIREESCLSRDYLNFLLLPKSFPAGLKLICDASFQVIDFLDDPGEFVLYSLPPARVVFCNCSDCDVFEDLSGGLESSSDRVCRGHDGIGKYHSAERIVKVFKLYQRVIAEVGDAAENHQVVGHQETL